MISLIPSAPNLFNIMLNEATFLDSQIFFIKILKIIIKKIDLYYY
jgi:hypothetical protein